MVRMLRLGSFTLLLLTLSLFRPAAVSAVGCNYGSVGLSEEAEGPSEAYNRCMNIDCDHYCGENELISGCETQTTSHGVDCGEPYQVGLDGYRSDGQCTCGY